MTKYYAVPFTSGGITLRLDVSVGYITCYASDIFRNPGPDNYVWLINTRGYADGFIDPASQFGRSGTRYIYIALVGVDPLNTYLLNSTSGNFSSQGRILAILCLTLVLYVHDSFQRYLLEIQYLIPLVEVDLDTTYSHS